MQEYQLKYGMNPHQKNAKIFSPDESQLPIKILNGNPGYINFLDALNSWQLVSELKTILKMPAAASFKHVSPAGAAVAIPLSEKLKKTYFVDDLKLSPLASAYVRARGADRMSSFGDWAALSDTVDRATAEVLKREVSDGVIAPGYTPEALEILKTKRKRNYNIVEIKEDYQPGETELRSIFGVRFEQSRNDRIASFDDLNNIVTKNKELTEQAKRDLLLGITSLKYTQSNSVCYVLDGQVIGCGAGQQSRVHCTRLAGDKTDIWYLRQHPSVLNMKFKEGLGRPGKDNAIDLFIRDDVTDRELEAWKKSFEEVPTRLSKKEKEDWLSGLKGVSLCSDAFFPFRDNIDRAYKSGVKYVVQPGGSIRDDVVIEACNDYDMTMACTGIRLFHH
ncbi:MAG: phosphoribosylaminoimidazolecarboxamide formyltransferase [Halanaerobiales bacterium]